MLELIRQFTWREIEARYRGSMLGVFWSVLTPILMLAVFTYVFAVIFQSRWGQGKTSTAEFGIILFAGMNVFNLFAEALGRSPTLITSQPNLVKKVVFPLEILPVVAVGSALFQAAVTFVILIAFQVALGTGVQWTALATPLLLLPILLFALGMSWFLAALGVYVRDIGQIMSSVITALMFLSPVFYPSSALPEWIRPYATNNPLAQSIEMVRNAVVFGTLPDPFSVILSAAGGLAFAGLGYLFFQKTRKGFADVL